jgi:ABC-type dipeptide/oligopeptide/nickel transport system ATPase subunit
MQFRISIQNVQHIRALRLELDLEASAIFCLAGRNAVGKTTLVRSLKNLAASDTFLKTAGPRIFAPESRIEYELDGNRVVFLFDASIGSLNCRSVIPSEMRDLVSTELPMPYGARFNFHRSASEADAEIREAVVLGDYSTPAELIDFLSAIYSTSKFERLIEVRAKGAKFYCILLDNDRYLREDYFSSGEYFLINLYRAIRGSSRLIVVDEIEISLDAAAQVQLASWLRGFCTTYGRSLMFTTQSLTVMKTLKPAELRYMEIDEGVVHIYPASYSYIKARLFGFRGWDRYILTEDEVLASFIEHLVGVSCDGGLLTHKVIHIGGGHQVVDLMLRNQAENFLADGESVMAILDGDQVGRHAARDQLHYVPFQSVEKALLTHYFEDGFPFRLPGRDNFTSGKDLFNSILQQSAGTAISINEYLREKYRDQLVPLVDYLRGFVGVGLR